MKELIADQKKQPVYISLLADFLQKNLLRMTDNSSL